MGAKLKKRKDGRYCRRITLPGGKRLDVYGRTQREVNEQVQSLQVRYAMGGSHTADKITVTEWTKTWWETEKAGKTGPSSQCGYINAINKYIFPEIGNLKLSEVKPLHCQQILNNMSNLSQSLQRQVKAALNGIFRSAVTNSLIMGNPAQYIKFSAPADEKRVALEPDQVKELLLAVEGTRAKLPVYLSLYCGLRRGEIMGLMWTDIVGSRLNIQRAVEVTHNTPILKSTKSKAGIRQGTDPTSSALPIRDGGKIFSLCGSCCPIKRSNVQIFF